MPPQIVSRPSRLSLTAAVLALILPSVAAADDSDTKVTNLVTKQLNVLSNGVSYTKPPILSNLIADVRVQADAGVSGKIKNWKVWLRIFDEDGWGIDFSNFAYSKTYPWNDRPKTVDRKVQLSVPSSFWGSFAVNYCNDRADDLRAQGLSDAVIFGQDRDYDFAVSASLNVQMSGADNVLADLEQSVFWGQYKKVRLVCKKWSGPAMPQVNNSITTAPAKVVNKGLSIYEMSTLGGTCKIRLDGWVTTDQKGAKVSIQYRNPEGKISETHHVNTGESKTATFSHWYDVPNNPDGPENGQVRMVGVSHDFQTAWADYSLNCVKGGPGTLAVNAPPKLTMTIQQKGKVMVHGRICPESLQLVGVLQGQGNFSGKALFYGPGYLSPLRDYSITHGQKVLIGAEVKLDWSKVAVPPVATAPLAQVREFGLNVTNENNVVIASLPKRLYAMECFRPAVNPVARPQGGFTIEPRNPAAATTAPKAILVQPAGPSRTLQRAVPQQAVPLQVLPQQAAPLRRPVRPAN